MTETIHELVTILAAVDSIFIPTRSFDRAPRVAYQRRRAYQASGVPWPDASGDGGERKEIHTLRNAMEAAGLLQKLVRKNDRSTAVKLTDKGEDKAREAVGLPPIIGAIDALETLRQLQECAFDILGVKWINECRIANIGYADTVNADARAKLVKLEELFLPALIRGWALAASDTAGRVSYSITSAGERAIEQRADEFWEPKLNDRDAFQLYQSQLRQQIGALAGAPLIDQKECGPLPLPTSTAKVSS